MGSTAQFDVFWESRRLLTLGFEPTGVGASPTAAARVEAPFVVNTWYQIELRDIDWQQGVFEVYVDGNLIAAGVAFTGAAPGVDEVRLYSSGAASTAYVDAIEFWGP